MEESDYSAALWATCRTVIFRGEFRIAIFGGFNKEDVCVYMQQMEKEAEITKFEYQREILGLKSKLQKVQDEKEFL